MRRLLGVKSALFGCMYVATVGCMYAVVGCMYAVVGCISDTADSLPDSR